MYLQLSDCLCMRIVNQNTLSMGNLSYCTYWIHHLCLTLGILVIESLCCFR